MHSNKITTRIIVSFCASIAVLLMPVPCFNLNANTLAPGEVYPVVKGEAAFSLNGQWAFRYVQGLESDLIPAFASPQYDAAQWDRIEVPSNWELQGFAEPHYALELQDGLGLYRTEFEIPKTWKGRRVFLHFAGVAFGFEAWLNGEPVGSHCASAFNPTLLELTDALRSVGPDAKQILAVCVTTKPKGWEFDANDDWALSGIFRDVTVFSVPEVFVSDFHTETHLMPEGGSAELRLNVQLGVDDVLSQQVEVEAELLSPSGECWEVQGKVGKDGRIEQLFHIDTPALWTAETPELYDLAISVLRDGNVIQRFEKRIGLREITIRDGVLRLNGSPIKLRGVNRHDEAPDVGRAVSEPHFRRDIELMKKGNVNYVRTSHYPPDEGFIELCDELGLYVMCEVSIGKGEEHQVDPAYLENILDRTRATIARDKNHASVIIWSIGNENPVNDAELEASRLARQLDPTRPICIPKIGSYFWENYQKIPEYVDIYSPHYPTHEMLEGYVEKLNRPTVFTEYAHALGLATDRIQAQWEVMQQTPQFAGGSIWHLMDQGLLRYVPEGVDPNASTPYAWPDKYHCYDTHGNDGGDGVVYADRTPQTDFWVMRKVYAPVQFKEAKVERKLQGDAGYVVTLSVENRYDFTSLDQITLGWKLWQNGQVSDAGEQVLKAPPHGIEALEFEILDPGASADGTDFLMLELECRDQADRIVNEETVLLSEPLEAMDLLNRSPDCPDPADVSSPVLEVGGKVVTVTYDTGRLILNKTSGVASLVDRFGRTVVSGIYPRAGRVATMSELRVADKTGLWKHPVLQLPEGVQVEAVADADGVVIRVTGKWSDSKTPEKYFTGGYVLRLAASGLVSVDYDFQAFGEGMFSEAGLSLQVPSQLSEFHWVGQGPYAGYPDKDKLTTMGAYQLNAQDLYFKGNRRKTSLAMLTRPEGWGLALCCAPSDVAVEHFEGSLLLSHNVLMSGLGNKFTAPETQMAVVEHSRIKGAFTLQLLSENWNEALINRFGKPGPAAEVFHPFYHSYDQ